MSVTNLVGRRRAAASAAAVLVLAILAPAPAAAQDLDHGPPWILKGPIGAPGAAATHGDDVWVVETALHRLQRAVVPPGALALEPAWTAVGEVADRAAPDALAFPQGAAVDAAGNLYVADTGRGLVRLFRPAAGGSYVLDPAFAAGGPPPSDPRPLDSPRDVAVGSDGRVYVLDAGNGRILVADGPDAAGWELFRADPAWADPSGIGVGPDGTVWLADAGSHRVLGFGPGGGTTEIGRWGEGSDGLRRPHDVAVDPTGTWIYVADTDNHRVAVFSHDGHPRRSLGGPPLLGQPVRVHADAGGRVWTTDTANDWIVVWPGPANVASGLDVDAAFDGFLRDTEVDPGDEPSPAAVAAASPDILVRNAPDLDIAAAELEALVSFSEETPIYGRPHYLYFEVRNRGTESLVGAAIGVWTREPGEAGTFPASWRPAGVRGGGGPPARFAEVAFVPPGGRTIAGPLVWTPSAPEDGGSCTDETLLMARLVDLGDPTYPLQGEDLEQARRSNNVAVRRLPVVPEPCAVPGDRYERNDHLAAYAVPDERWEHLAARCPREVTRRLGLPYPEAECAGIFEDGPAPRSAEEIWNLVIPDLTLHATADRDFFRVRLPDLQDPRWGLNDIRPEAVRLAAARSPGAVPEAMPECGVVQRVEFGPPALDNRVWVNVTSEFVITAVPTAGDENALTPVPVGVGGEALRVYRAGEEALEYGTDSPLTKRIVCPRSLEGLAEVELSFGDRRDPEGEFRRRPFDALGGYELRVTYHAFIERGNPGWVAEQNEGRGIRRIPCFMGPGAPGPGGRPPGPGRGMFGGFDFGGFGGGFGFGAFPFCVDGPGFGPVTIMPDHPQTPGLVGCIADGPGCLELSRFRWAGGRAFDLLIRAPVDLRVRLLGRDGRVLAVARQVEGVPDWAAPFERQAMLGWTTQRLRVRDLGEGDYFLEIDGPPTRYGIEYVADGAFIGPAFAVGSFFVGGAGAGGWASGDDGARALRGAWDVHVGWRATSRLSVGAQLAAWGARPTAAGPVRVYRIGPRVDGSLARDPAFAGPFVTAAPGVAFIRDDAASRVGAALTLGGGYRWLVGHSAALAAVGGVNMHRHREGSGATPHAGVELRLRAGGIGGVLR
jgi:DNA-binding beta-propeller fold protein YncE